MAEGVACLEFQTGIAPTANKGELQPVIRAEARVRLESDVAESRVRTSADRGMEVVDTLFALQIHPMVANVGYLEGHAWCKLIRDAQVPLVRIDVRLMPLEAVCIRWRRSCLREERIIRI